MTPNDSIAPQGSATLIVQLLAKEGQQTALEQELTAMLGPTRDEEGCIAYTLHHSEDSPGLFLLYEVWASREHHARHTQTQHFLRWVGRKDAVVASRTVSYWKLVG